jgi:3-isopropylmalate/(R)-2-methylmalate dehydratase small subunit
MREVAPGRKRQMAILSAEAVAVQTEFSPSTIHLMVRANGRSDGVGRKGGTASALRNEAGRPGVRAAVLGWAGLWLKTGAAAGTLGVMQSVISGPVYVVGDNIDTDQIIPAQYLNLVPTIPEEYEKLGCYALSGLPESLYGTRYVKENQLDSEYPIVVGGRNFGCGSSREHAPIALGSAGCKVVLAESFARIFFRNSIATGELYPCECGERLCEVLNTGEVVRVDLDALTVTVTSTGKEYRIKPLGDVRPVVDAGGLFNYARKVGMIGKKG